MRQTLLALLTAVVLSTVVAFAALLNVEPGTLATFTFDLDEGPFAPPGCAGMDFDDTMFGTAGDDELDGGPGRDLIFGLGGNDQINGGSGNDCIVGGDGNDTLQGAAGDDAVLGNDGDDRIEGGGGNDRLFGGAGNDRIVGGGGDDIIDGGDGVDICQGGAGTNSFNECESTSSSEVVELFEEIAAPDPTQAVVAFYGLIGERRLAEAYHLLTATLRESPDFSPFEAWAQGYADTTSITLIAVSLLEQGDGFAIVAVEVESASTDPSLGAVRHRFAGSWSLFLAEGQWLLDDPQIVLVESSAE